MRVIKVLFFLVIALTIFGAGYLLRQVQDAQQKPQKKITSFVEHDYFCPMHPHVHSDKPGKCPICNMDLVLRKDAPGAGTGAIQISTDKQQLIGVQTGFAQVTSETREIHAQGKVTFDETAISHIHSRVEGWIEDVYVDFTGKWVDVGQPLLTIYSPEMLASQRELLLAAKAQAILAKSSDPAVASQTVSMFEAAKSRLQLWELSADQIEKVIRTGKPIEYYTLYAHHSGFVTERKAFPHQRATPDMELYTIVDLSRVWITADIFERDALLVRAGQDARVSLSYLPGQALRAKVNFIQPQVDPVTRTIKVRLEAANPKQQLKQEMFVAVDFRIPSAPVLTVPAEAILDSGLKKIVFLDKGDGKFEPRTVETGDRRDGRIEIVSGLTAGEKIATSGVFLIDSESQLKTAAGGRQP
jgi:membrane fusion protein, copper/silver efflux system